MSGTKNAYQNLLNRLDSLRRRSKTLNLARGIVFFLAVAVLTVLCAIAIEALFHMNSTGRYTLLAVLLLANAATLSWFVGRPCHAIVFRRHSPDNISLALKVGQHFSAIRDRLADALQVFQKHAENKEGYSLELADASLDRIYDEAKEHEFTQAASTRPFKSALKISACAVVVCGLVFWIFSQSLSGASNRVFHPSVYFARNAGLVLEIAPGDTQVVKGESLAIVATVRGEFDAEVKLFVKSPDAIAYDRHVLKKTRGQSFSYQLDDITTDKIYYVEAGRQRSADFSISIIERPFVRSLHVKLKYPAYSKLGRQILDENVGDIASLKGTRVELLLQTNKSVSAARLVFDDQASVPMTVSGKEISGKFTVARSGSYHVELTDGEGLNNSDPIEYRISLIEDHFPIVQIPFPGQDVDLSKDMLLPLTIDAQDDFGIARLRLGYRISKQGIDEGDLQFIKVPFTKANSDNLMVNYAWDMSGMGLMPEDVVEYYAEVFDNDTVSGPKRARSLTYRVRFPSIYEMYEEIAAGHEETFEDLAAIVAESESLREMLAEIVQEMKRDPELNWEQKQEVQEAAAAQEKMQEKLQQVEEKLDSMIDRMEQNDLLSMETLQKYRELQSLMQEMLTEELREALEQLQKAMADLDPQEMKKAMEQFSASQEDFLKSMERTLNLLKKLQIEQKLDESLRRAQDLLRRQEELNQNAANSQSQKENSKYAQEQKGIRQDTEDLGEQLEDLMNQMSEFPQMPMDQVESAQNQIREGGLPQQMDQAAQQFQSGQMQSGQETGQQVSQGLQQMVESLQSAKKQMSEEEKQKIMQALRRSSHQLLNLSKQQERLKQKTQGSDRNTPGMNEMAEKQQDMLSGLGRVTAELFELSQNTFFVTPEIGKALGKAMNGMQESLAGLEGRNPGKASGNQASAMAGLNEATAGLRDSMQGLSGASSGIGFEEMMQRMMGLSGQQQGVNQQTSQLGEGGQSGQLSMQQQAAMARLAREQAGVQKSLQQLMKEAGSAGQSDLLGDMAQVGKEMEEVVKELAQRNVSGRTIERQKRILSRLLDAQRSMQDRDYSRRRKAETAKAYTVISPSALSDPRARQGDRIRNELLKAMKEGYSRDYKELIQKYFETLAAEGDAETLNE